MSKNPKTLIADLKNLDLDTPPPIFDRSGPPPLPKLLKIAGTHPPPFFRLFSRIPDPKKTWFLRFTSTLSWFWPQKFFRCKSYLFFGHFGPLPPPFLVTFWPYFLHFLTLFVNFFDFFWLFLKIFAQTCQFRGAPTPKKTFSYSRPHSKQNFSSLMIIYNTLYP